MHLVVHGLVCFCLILSKNASSFKPNVLSNANPLYKLKGLNSSVQRIETPYFLYIHYSNIKIYFSFMIEYNREVTICL